MIWPGVSWLLILAGVAGVMFGGEMVGPAHDQLLDGAVLLGAGGMVSLAVWGFAASCETGWDPPVPRAGAGGQDGFDRAPGGPEAAATDGFQVAFELGGLFCEPDPDGGPPVRRHHRIAVLRGPDGGPETLWACWVGRDGLSPAPAALTQAVRRYARAEGLPARVGEPPGPRPEWWCDVEAVTRAVGGLG